MSYYNDKRKILLALKDYLQQDELEPFSVFVIKHGFPLGFDKPMIQKMLENNFNLTIEKDKVVKNE